MNKKSQFTQFNFSQLALVFVCAFFLVGITFLKDGFSVKNLAKIKTEKTKTLTYEEVKQQIEKENKPKLDEALAKIGADSQEQLAILDPAAAGQVLGANTNNSDDFFVNPEEIFSQDVMEAIKISSVVSSTPENIKSYAGKIILIENSLNSLEILANLNSDDKEVLNKNSAKAKAVILALSKLSVPEELVEYHKYKMLFYLSISRLSEVMSGKRGSEEVDSTTQIFFGAMQKIESIQENIYQKYQISF